MKKAALSLAAAISLVAAGSIPATAAPFSGHLVFLNGFVWDMNIEPFNSQLNEGEFVEEATVDNHDYEIDGQYYNTTYGDTLDLSEFQAWGPDSGANLYPSCDSADIVTDQATGDVIVTCTPTDSYATNGSLDAQRLSYYTEFRFFNVGESGALARVSLVVSNDSGVPVEFAWQVHQSFGECESGLTTTGSGDDTWQANDGWVDCAADGPGEAPVTFAYGHPDATDYPDLQSLAGGDTAPDDENYVWSKDEGEFLTLADGQSDTYSFFVATRNGPAGAAPYTDFQEQDLAQFSECAFSGGLNERLLAGLDETPANWVNGGEDGCTFNADPADASLASTGVDATGGIAFGALALAAGVALVIARRRRTV